MKVNSIFQEKIIFIIYSVISIEIKINGNTPYVNWQKANTHIFKWSEPIFWYCLFSLDLTINILKERNLNLWAFIYYYYCITVWCVSEESRIYHGACVEFCKVTNFLLLLFLFQESNLSPLVAIAKEYLLNHLISSWHITFYIFISKE